MVTDLTNTYNQIIVIGNGFDLACGLPSNYSSFFNSIISKSDSNTTDYVNISKNSINIWELIFIYATHHPVTYSKSSDNIPWQDVEEVIKRCVSLNSDDDYTPCTPMISYHAMENTDQIFSNPITQAIALQLCNRYPSLLDDVKKDAQRLGFLRGDGITIDNQYWARNNNRIALTYIQELYQFEIKFKDYLSPHAAKTEYLKAANELYLNISNYCETKIETETADVVLSFNYTTPLLELIDKGDEEIDKTLWAEKNIHGTLSTPTTKELPSPIIFGIDGFTPEGMRDGDVYQIFSKSYRQLNLKQQKLPTTMTNPLRTIFDPLQIPDSIRCIKIFGHSFGDADYSYYKTIFNSVDIFNSNIIIYILYKKDHEPDTSSIYKLLNRYSDEVHNSSNVNSASRTDLLQQLLMEDRIRLREISN